MIKIILPVLALFFCSLASYTQVPAFESFTNPIEYVLSKNNAANPCITALEYEIIEKRCAENVKLLKIEKGLQINASTTSLNWPLRPAVGFTDCSYYFLSGYVDQNPASGVFKDWNCGAHTYDGHGGTDIAIWPFSFNKVNNSQVEVIAAAPGTIIDKHDGEYDRNCVGPGTPLQANYIIVQHGDGSRALYWHVKKNSVTSKAIGQTVVAGEYLAIAASSGSSGGPHLHFEVWAGSTISTRVDPFYGPCNSLNPSGWWASQKPYTEPAIVKASIHITDYFAATCPNLDSIYESTLYAIPFTGPGLTTNYAKFYIFFRDATTGSIVDLKILNPNGSTFNSWNYTFPGNYLASYWGWSKKLPLIPGVYTFQATYNGISCSQQFTITTATGTSEADHLLSIKIYPNPSKGQFVLDSKNQNTGTFEIYNLLDAKIFQTQLSNQKLEINLNEESGIYFYQFKGHPNVFSSGKLVIE